MYTKLLRRKQHDSTTLIIPPQKNPNPIWGLSRLKDLSRTRCQEVGRGEEPQRRRYGTDAAEICFSFLRTTRTEEAERVKDETWYTSFSWRGAHGARIFRSTLTHIFSSRKGGKLRSTKVTEKPQFCSSLLT